MTDFESWMNKKKLKLNEGSTECMLVGTKRMLQNFSHFTELDIGGTVVKLSNEINLGIAFDQKLSMRKQVQNVVQAGNYHLRNIAFLKKDLDKDTMKMLVNNYVVTRLDYCNSLYYKLPDYLLKKLQVLQNRAARMIANIRPWDSATPTLMELHWLPIKARIEYKICLLAQQAVVYGEPRYLRDYLVPYKTDSQMETRLTVDIFRLNEPCLSLELGRRAFECSAPRLYNKLPTSVKECRNIEAFKKLLKTHV